VNPAQAKINLHVRAALRPIPNSVVWHDAKPGSIQKAEVLLADMLDDRDSGSDLPIISASTVDGLVVNCLADQGDCVLSGYEAKRRFTISVALTAPVARSIRREMIFVKGRPPGRQTIQIPLTCYTESGVRLYPPAVSLVRSDSTREVETGILCYYPEEALDGPTVISKPDGVSIDFERIGPGIMNIKLLCKMPKTPGVETGQLVVSFSRSFPHVEIPISLMLSRG
jgi:hypothetical protein